MTFNISTADYCEHPIPYREWEAIWLSPFLASSNQIYSLPLRGNIALFLYFFHALLQSIVSTFTGQFHQCLLSGNKG